MSLAAEVVLLAEDVRHRKLIRRHLIARGYNHRRIRVVPWTPKFETPCIGFVIDQYPVEVEALRKLANRRSCALVVVVDADEAAVERRLQQLDVILRSHKLLQRQTSEAISIVIPKRNIETWMHYLCGNEVDEVVDYKPLCRSLDAGESATQFARFTIPRRPIPQDCPDSLRYCCEEELPRIPSR